MRPLSQALLAQALAVPVALTLHALLPTLGYPWLQGSLACLIAARLGSPLWWLPWHLLLPPLGALLLNAALPPSVFLAVFVLLWLIYWRSDESRVPLYLSNATTSAAVLELLPAAPCQVLDLGCGLGGPLRYWARARPDCRFVGLEHAPLPWLIARLRCAGLSNVRILRGDFWPHSLAPYALVYAFLSPAPMAKIAEKAAAQLRPGALLVSNSFLLPAPLPPGLIHETTLTLDDRRRTRLYCYRAVQ